MVLGSSQAACYQSFNYGGPETGPKKHFEQPKKLQNLKHRLLMDWSKELTDYACEMTTSILHESKVRDQTVCIRQQCDQ